MGYVNTKTDFGIMKYPDKNIKKILIVKLCCLGDIIQILPAVNILRKNFPEAKITLLADKWILPLQKYFKDIDDVIILENTFSRNLFLKTISGTKLIGNLLKEKFDLALVSHRNNIFGWITLLAGIRYRLGFKGTRNINFPVSYDPLVNESERYLSILRNFGLNTEGAECKLIVNRSRDEITEELNLDKEKLNVGIFPFGGVNPGMIMTIRRWGKENFLKLADKLHNDGYNIILLEGINPDERLKNIQPKNNLVTANIDIEKIFACDVYIGNDTGSLHIASAFNKKVVGIYGPTDENIFGPIGNKKNSVFINKRVSCSPCFNTKIAIERNDKKYWRGNEFICHTGTNECLKEIKVEEVYNAVNYLIHKKD